MNAYPVRHARAGGCLVLIKGDMKEYYVYILASKKNGVLYIGITNDITRRVLEHKTNLNKGFSWRYDVKRLVYYETFTSIRDAIIREKRLKKWNRAWKVELIEKENSEWEDLSRSFDSDSKRFPLSRE